MGSNMLKSGSSSMLGAWDPVCRSICILKNLYILSLCTLKNTHQVRIRIVNNLHPGGTFFLYNYRSFMLSHG